VLLLRHKYQEQLQGHFRGSQQAKHGDKVKYFLDGTERIAREDADDGLVCLRQHHKRRGEQCGIDVYQHES
jgi:hypothetical protein